MVCMKLNDCIAVFAYQFPHKKSQDFLVELALAGFKRVVVIAAPRKQLPPRVTTGRQSSLVSHVEPLATEQVCGSLNFPFHQCEHGDIEQITALQEKYGFQLGIISGARIIKSEVIKLFEEGILNFHPGKLPETAGLDSFFYTIVKSVSLGVTAHFIDSRVDAGRELFFEQTGVGAQDPLDLVRHNNYLSQIRALRRFLKLRELGLVRAKPVIRPHKNSPMSALEMRHAEELFPAWRAGQHLEQRGNSLLSACRDGLLDEVFDIVRAAPALLEFADPAGCTPLMVACGAQHAVLAESLVKLGANVDAQNARGETALILTTIKLAATLTGDCSVLEVLLRANADHTLVDAAGKNAFDYAEEYRAKKVLLCLCKQLERR